MSEDPRMSHDEVREYWRAHEERFGAVDFEEDPEGISGYLGPGQPHWLNELHAALQLSVFERLVGQVAPPRPGARALDVGCGSARWTRRVADRGWAAVGIDLQPQIIEANKRRFPDLEFHAVAVQDLPIDQRFDLVTSVGVLVHVPADEQASVVHRLGRLTEPGGHAIVLETLYHDRPNAFPLPQAGWRELFEQAGFESVAEIPYLHQPLRRAARAVRRVLRPGHRTEETLPTAAAPAAGQSSQGAVWSPRPALRRLITADYQLEPALQRARAPLRAKWCGYLFERRG